MENHNIAIVGLGRVGTAFLKKALTSDCVMTVKAVCEMCDTPGKELAEKEEIPVVELSEIVGLGVDVDVIFDLTGDKHVSQILHQKLVQCGNTYTDVVPVRVARLIWGLIAGDEYLPDMGKCKNQIYADMLLDQMNKS